MAVDVDDVLDADAVDVDDEDIDDVAVIDVGRLRVFVDERGIAGGEAFNAFDDDDVVVGGVVVVVVNDDDDDDADGGDIANVCDFAIVRIYTVDYYKQ